MNPSGLWQGKSQGRIGHFKFINVELLPDRNTLRQQRRSASEKVPNYTNSGPPKTVEELLKRIGLEVSQIAQCLKITEKVSLKIPKLANLASFRKPENGQTVLPDRTKIDEKCQH